MHLVSTIDLVYKYFIYEFLHLGSCHKKESNWQNNANVDKDISTYLRHISIWKLSWDYETQSLLLFGWTNFCGLQIPQKWIIASLEV